MRRVFISAVLSAASLTVYAHARAGAEGLLPARGPCALDPALDRATFEVSFPASVPKGARGFVGHFSRCEVIDHAYGEPIEPRARRHYVSGETEWGVVVESRGDGEAEVHLSYHHRDYRHLAGYVATMPTERLLWEGGRFAGVFVQEADDVGRMVPAEVMIRPVAPRYCP